MKLRIIIGSALAALLTVLVYSYLHRPVQIEHHPLILGHGGSGIRSMYPLSSLESINRALAFPIDGVELDVQITADSTLVAFHDTDLEINTNCSGRVSDFTLSELRACRQSTWFNETPITTLDKIIRTVPEGTTFSLDLKQSFFGSSALRRSYIKKLASLVHTYPQHLFLFESPDIQILNEIRTKNRSARLFLLTEDVDSAVETAHSSGLMGISVNLNTVNHHDVYKIRNQKLKVMLWGTGSVVSNRKALGLQPDIIQTDDIESMMKLLQAD